MKNSKPSHIFIVGVGRSGTKFLMNVLNNHSKVNICPETHFFSRLLHQGVLKAIDHIGDMHNDLNVRQLFNEAFSGKIFGTYWKQPISVSKENLVNNFLNSNRTEKELFEIIINEHRIVNNKIIAGEKTPSHLFHVPKLLQWFPEAKIIHIIRDPRDVLESEINKEDKPDYPVKHRGLIYNFGLFVYVLLQWISAVNLNSKYQKRFSDNYTIVKYEDLLDNHLNTVKQICLFLGLEFESQMLNPPKVDSSFNTDMRRSSRNLLRLKLLSLFLNKKMAGLGYK